MSTGPDGLESEVVEVFSLDTLELLGPEVLEDKIVFFNRPMDPTFRGLMFGAIWGKMKPFGERFSFRWTTISSNLSGALFPFPET